MTRKEQFGEYTAYASKRGIRFMKGGRLISEKKVPVEAVEILKNRLTGTRGRVEAPTYPKPSEEELARMREESLQVKPELQMSEQEVKDRTPISSEDFDEPTEDVQAQVEDMLKDSSGNEPLPRPNEPVRPSVDTDFMESISIHTASLEDMARALYDRFGIYTVYLRELPRSDEINPLTARQFNNYHLGIAYQAAIYASNQGLLDVEPESLRAQMEEGRAASENLPLDSVNHTMAEARRANDFNFRTSVRANQTKAATRIEHVKGEDGVVRAVQVPIEGDELNPNLNGATQRYDAEEEDIIVEPPIYGGKQVIRPDW